MNREYKTGITTFRDRNSKKGYWEVIRLPCDSFDTFSIQFILKCRNLGTELQIGFK